ncbi:hypothetical protein [Legionella maioricensis]|uniref:Uncharacterized protein n=1 Tax=Legionella maioricensis TaxID=2896528 RepID=A0A9X2IA38_9GAMM|nr:hypothetical protein [Legionella maioricensis]MCL9683390.1 hypothetical protein [Legionella maioricensis]MCL9685914.1 hypothetical protein [Legionella maioricensis]
MRNRINRRTDNLASVSKDKALEDEHNTSGIFFMYSFFDKETHNNHKIKIDKVNRWRYETSNELVPENRYMFAVGKNGALYLGNPTVHSQFKAGKQVQSAGWIEYQWDNEEQQAKILIDNCSGHYTPTLSQFIQTLYGLHQAKFLPDHLEIRLSKFTLFDYENMSPFWNEIIKEAKLETTEVLSLTYSEQDDGFVFMRSSGETAKMDKKDIFPEKTDLRMEA